MNELPELQDEDDQQPQLMGGAVDVGGMQVPLSPQDAQALLDAAEEAEAQQKADMESLMKALQDKLDAVIVARRPIEKRWVDDLRLYEGMSRIVISKNDTSSATNSSDAPKIHATRLATDHFEARVSDMLFPTNDYAFDLRPTPDDEHSPPTQMNPETGMAGVPQAPDAKTVEESCRRMKKVIFDQLADSKFAATGRKFIRDAARIGAGVVMGPVNSVRVRRRFVGPKMEMQVTETTQPDVQYCDPWNFYPDLVPTIDRAEFAFYLHLMSRSEVQELKDSPSFDADEINALLKEEPDLGALTTNLNYRNTHLDRIEQISEKYPVWRYTGTLSPKEMRVMSNQGGAIGGSVSDDLDDMEVDCTCDEDRMPMIDMWFSQSHVLKARIRPIERDYRIPYYVFSPFPADDTPFGYGIPYMGRDSARVLDAAWQIALHNGSLSAGPLMIMRAGKLVPRDRSMEYRGPKIYDMTDPDTTMEEALRVENIPNNLEQALTLLDRAKAIHNDETMMADVLSGDATKVEPTASGLAMKMNSSTVLIKRAAACGDDEVFSPLMQRMYWWNMLFNDREDIKGEYDVIPLGQSKQMVKDIQVQHLQAFMAMTGADPTLAPYIDKYSAMKMWANLAELPVDQLLLDKDEVDQKMAQAANAPDPARDLANAKVAESAAKAHSLVVGADAQMAEIKMKMQTGQISTQEGTLQMEDYNTRKQEAAASVQVATIRAQADIAKAQHRAQESSGDNQTDLAVTGQKTQADLTREGMKTRIAAEKLARGQST